MRCQSLIAGLMAVDTAPSVADWGQAKRAMWWPYTGASLASQANVGRKGMRLYCSPHFALAPHSLSPTPEQSGAPRRHTIAVAPPCPLATIIAPLLNFSHQQLRHLYLYLPESLLPHDVPW